MHQPGCLLTRLSVHRENHLNGVRSLVCFDFQIGCPGNASAVSLRPTEIL